MLGGDCGRRGMRCWFVGGRTNEMERSAANSCRTRVGDM